METGSVEEIVRSLNGAGARYLIAGGLAVVAHGYVRLTADLDIILDLDHPELRTWLAALGALGYRPRAPVPLEDFADAGKRRSWIAEKNMKVFSLFSPRHPATEIDIFAQPPLDFSSAYAKAARFEAGPGITATFLSREDLISLKRAAGRPKDLLDIERLEALGRPDGS